MIHKIESCSACLQYLDDCECCPDCGGADVHRPDCDMAETRAHRRQAMVVRRETIRGMGAIRNDTIRVSPVIVRRPGSEGLSGLESTGSHNVVKPTASDEPPATEDGPIRAVVGRMRERTKRGVSVRDAARIVMVSMPDRCAEVMAIVGAWPPSDEPEVAALQDVYMRGGRGT